MGVFNSPNIFLENIPKRFEGFNMEFLYIDNILVINKHNVLDHLKYLEKII